MRKFTRFCCGFLWFLIVFERCVYCDDEPEACDVGGVSGLCVPLPECTLYLVLLQNAATLMEGLKVTQDRQCGFEGLNAKVCCPAVPSTTTAPTEAPSPDFVDAFPKPAECGAVLRENETNRSSSTPWYEEPDDPDYRYPVVAISHGRVATDRSIALWMALLGYRDPFDPWQCGGSVITARHVLTAAHCIKDSLYVVRVGELDLAAEDTSAIDILVKKAIVHEQYTKYTNDIAIVVLKDSIDFANNRHIAPVCLPSSPKQESAESLRLATDGIIMGWGDTEKQGQRPSKLLYADVDIYSRAACEATYGRHNVTLDERVFCAGDAKQGRDACSGDSGGPFITRLGTVYESFYYQLGIVSYGYFCSLQRNSGVYTNVTTFMPWIEEKVLGRPGPWAGFY